MKDFNNIAAATIFNIKFLQRISCNNTKQVRYVQYIV